MGNSSSRIQKGPLQPSPFPIGVNGFYCQHQNEFGLRVRERKLSLSGDDFAVKDAASGQTMFKVGGTVFSLRGKKEIKDVNGNVLFLLKSKLLAFAKTYKGEDPKTGKEIFQVQSKIFKIGTKLTITFQNIANKGEPQTLFLNGSILHRNAEITLQSGQPIARITREFMNAGEMLFDRQTYVLMIAPNVDASLLLAICICLDEATSENRSAS